MHRRSPVGTPGRPIDPIARLGVLLVLVLAFAAVSWATGGLGGQPDARDGGRHDGREGGVVVATTVAAAGPVDVRRAVFDEAVTLGPGDRRTALIEVENVKAAPAHVLVRLRARGVTRLLEAGGLTVDARIPGTGWRRIQGAPPYDVARIESLPAGARVPVEIRATVPRGVAPATTVASDDLGLRIVLARAYSDEELAALRTPPADPQLQLVPLFLGLGMASVGVLVLALRTRRRRIRRRWV